MIDISRALQVDGWMKPEELTWLAEQASRCERILEVGSWMGRSAIGMAINTKGTVVCVDTWGGSGKEHADILRDKNPEWLMDQFVANTAGLSNIQTIRGDSSIIGKHYSGPLFDMIFIDGDHTFEGASKDIRAWLPHLSPGGLFSGHDFSAPFAHTVVRAVKDLIPRARPVGAGSIWAAV